jgi:hypothetical protein
VALTRDHLHGRGQRRRHCRRRQLSDLILGEQAGARQCARGLACGSAPLSHHACSCLRVEGHGRPDTNRGLALAHATASFSHAPKPATRVAAGRCSQASDHLRCRPRLAPGCRRRQQDRLDQRCGTSAPSPSRCRGGRVWIALTITSKRWSARGASRGWSPSHASAPISANRSVPSMSGRATPSA